MVPVVNWTRALTFEIILAKIIKRHYIHRGVLAEPTQAGGQFKALDSQRGQLPDAPARVVRAFAHNMPTVRALPL